MPLGIEGSAADISNGPYRAVRLFLFERGTKTVDAGVTVHVEGAGAVGYSVPVREDQNRRGTRYSIVTTMVVVIVLLCLPSDNVQHEIQR